MESATAPGASVALRFAARQRAATLATIAPAGAPRLVPICFVLALADRAWPVPIPEDGGLLYSALDEKPKRTADVRDLARVRDIARDPRVSLLFDRWSEDWSRLGWVRAEGLARLLEPDAEDAPEHRAALSALRERYAPYRRQRIAHRPLIAVRLTRVQGWGDLSGDD